MSMPEEKKDLTPLYERLGFSEQARCAIEAIRSSEPSRAVESRRNNVRGRYASEKMGVTIQFESHKNELARIKKYEHDSNVLEYYDQPPPIKLDYESSNGRRLGVFHTPDFFVICNDGAGWDECKKEEDLIRLAQEHPNRFCKDEDGEWRCPPGEAYAEPFGFFYRLCTSSKINWTYQRNINFLQDYLRMDAPEVSQEARKAVEDLVSSVPGITLDELYSRVEGKVSRDDIHTLIAIEAIYVDLALAPIPEPDLVMVFPDKETAVAFGHVVMTTAGTPADNLRYVDLAETTEIMWDGRAWTVLNAGETMVGLLGDGNEFRELPLAAFEELVKSNRITGLAKRPEQLPHHPDARTRFLEANKKDLAEANRRARIVLMRLRGEEIPKALNVPKRTLRSWIADYHRADSMYGAGYIGLLPKPRPGNRKSKLPSSTVKLMDDFIEHDYETLKCKKKLEVYAAYELECDRKGVIAVSYKTFCRAVKRRPRHTQALKREGKRAALAVKPFYWVLEPTTPRHGERPFELGHIDHTEFDAGLLCSETDRNLGRAWGTIMMDATCRRFLAVHVTYDPPSYRSCMMVMRECVRRFGRLPGTIIVDGGAEFESIYFETLLARYEVTKMTRPPAESRYGSVCERLFGTTNTRFIHNLEGNTQLMKNVRQVTGSVNPKHRAIWTLGRFYHRFREFAYEVYDNIDHPALDMTPKEAFALGTQRSGNRPHRLIGNLDEFKMFTLPTTRKGTAKVSAGRGIKVNNLYYWSEALRDPAVEQTEVAVRIDPFDIGTAYAFVQGMWVTCHSEHHLTFQGRSEREIMLASDELRRRKGLHSRQFNLTARKIAEFIESLEGEELLLMQRLKDRENRKVLDAIDDQEKNIVGSDEEALVSNDEQQMAASDPPVRHGRRSAKARDSKKKGSTPKDTYGRF
jgi:transposase InsO family protein